MTNYGYARVSTRDQQTDIMMLGVRAFVANGGTTGRFVADLAQRYILEFMRVTFGCWMQEDGLGKP